MIDVHCFTNLDGFETEEWPKRLPAVPQEGQYIESKKGRKLQICGMTWTVSGLLKIELHRW